MNRFRLDVSRKTGLISLWMANEQSPCGYTPLIAWNNIHGVKEFAEMLLDMYRHAIRENERVKDTSDRILQNVFCDEHPGQGGTNA